MFASSSVAARKTSVMKRSLSEAGEQAGEPESSPYQEIAQHHAHADDDATVMVTLQPQWTASSRPFSSEIASDDGDEEEAVVVVSVSEATTLVVAVDADPEATRVALEAISDDSDDGGCIPFAEPKGGAVHTEPEEAAAAAPRSRNAS